MTVRKGHTLLELVAVMAVLVAVAALSFPLIKPMLDGGHKDAAADVIRSRFSQAKTKAMSTGRPYSFECKKGSGKFRVVPDKDDMSGPGSDDGAFHSGELELPGGIPFGDDFGENSNDSDNGWIRVATFMPNGSAKHDAKVTIGQGPGAITLKLHSATGAVSTATGTGPAAEEKK